jgi:PUB domain
LPDLPDDQTLTVQNPSEEKYRRINLANAAIQSRVASLPSSVTFFELLGFQVSQDGITLHSIAARRRPAM